MSANKGNHLKTISAGQSARTLGKTKVYFSRGENAQALVIVALFFFALLAFVGARMAWEFIKGESESETVDIDKWANLLTLAVATSIDALAVGLSFAFLHINIWIAAAIIGAVAFSVSAVSYWLGRRVNAWIGRWALLLGAILLIAIGLRILISHWTA